MGEDGEISKTPESYYEPIEVRFGDIVQVIREDGYRAATGVLVKATSDTLVMDNLTKGEGGDQRVLPTGGTHYGKVEVIGHMDNALPKLIEALKHFGERFNVPVVETQKFIEEAEKEASKGPVMYTPARPRTEEEQAEIDRQLREEFPNFFKGTQSK